MEQQLPKNFEAYAEGRKNGFLKIKGVKESGRHVAGYFCTFAPLEIFDAAGVLAVSLCGMSGETIPDAETELPKNICPLVKSSYGFALSEKCPYTYYADMIVGETTCDAKKKMYERLGKLKDTYVMQLPQGVDEDDAKPMMVKEVKLLAKYVEKKFGVTITDEALRKAAVKRNEYRHALVELMELQTEVPAPIRSVQLYKFMDSIKFNFDLDAAIASVHELKAKLMAEKVPKDNEKRIMVTGCPIGGVLDKVVGAIENNGGRVVCYENCSGIKATRCYVDTDAPDIYEALADAYLKIGCSVMTPNPRRMENIPRLVEEFKVDGIIDVTLQTCHTYMIETRAVRRLCEGIGKPYMSLETDYSHSDDGQIDTRIAAFIETI